MHKQKISAILFDFDGVLSNGRFYSTIQHSHPKIHANIGREIFSGHAHKTVNSWMRGELTYEQLHARFADKIGADVTFLNRVLVDSVLQMPINGELMNYAQHVRDAGVRTAIFTDNMDVFDRVFAPYHKLHDKFDYIFSSSAYRKLKLDNNAAFLREVVATVADNPNEVLFLDDSPKIAKPMQDLGGHFYLYEQYRSEFPKFSAWFNHGFTLPS